jgi:hypothetical protein
MDHVPIHIHIHIPVTITITITITITANITVSIVLDLPIMEDPAIAILQRNHKFRDKISLTHRQLICSCCTNSQPPREAENVKGDYFELEWNGSSRTR